MNKNQYTFIASYYINNNSRCFLLTSSLSFANTGIVFAEEVITTLPVGDGPYGVAYNPDNGDMYVANAGTDEVSVIDGTTNSVIDTIEVGDSQLDCLQP